MKNKILAFLLSNVGPMLLNLISPEIVRIGVASGLDAIEAQVKRSDNQIDDKIVLPLLDKVRVAFDLLPDTGE